MFFIIWAVVGIICHAYLFDRDMSPDAPFPWGVGGFFFMLPVAMIAGPTLLLFVAFGGKDDRQ